MVIQDFFICVVGNINVVEIFFLVVSLYDEDFFVFRIFNNGWVFVYGIGKVFQWGMVVVVYD